MCGVRVSVIIPVYDDVRLQICLASIASQARAPSDPDLEIIVVDNGVEHEVGEICERFAPIVVHLRELRTGSYAARNAGLRVARGDLVAFTDADCIPTPSWLEAGRQAFEDLDTQVLTGPVELFARDPKRPNSIELNQLRTAFDVRRYVEEQRFGPTANLWTRASVVAEVGLFDDQLRSSGDVEWCRRAFECGYPIRYCSALIVRHPARRGLREVTLNFRRMTGGHFAVARREGLPGPSGSRAWPHRRVRAILSGAGYSRAQRARALAVELWLYVVRLAETLRLLLGGQPLR